MKCHKCGKDATSSITRRKDERKGRKHVDRTTKYYCKKCYADEMERLGFIRVRMKVQVSLPEKEGETDELHERTENL